MEQIPSISPAEWTIMQALWRGGPLSATEVYEEVSKQCAWHPKTVRTLLGRLIRKGAVRREKRGGVYRFAASVAEETCIREEGRSFLERCFGGRLHPMLAYFLEHEDLSAEDIEALRAKLDQQAERGKQP